MDIEFGLCFICCNDWTSTIDFSEVQLKCIMEKASDECMMNVSDKECIFITEHQQFLPQKPQQNLSSESQRGRRGFAVSDKGSSHRAWNDLCDHVLSWWKIKTLFSPSGRNSSQKSCLGTHLAPRYTRWVGFACSLYACSVSCIWSVLVSNPGANCATRPHA